MTINYLLAVIVILGVLLLIAVPAVNRVQTMSKQKAAKDQALMVLRGMETCNMSEETACSKTDLANYVEGDLSEVDYTYATGTQNLTKFEVTLSGYKVSITDTTGLSIASVKSAVSSASWSGTTASN